jgi:hypothetical protein
LDTIRDKVEKQNASRQIRLEEQSTTAFSKALESATFL